MTEQEINTVQDFAEQNNMPGAGSEKIRGKIIAIFGKSMPAQAKHSEIAAEVVAELESRGQFFFDEQRRDFASAMFFDSRRKILHRIGADMFLSWLSEFVGINRSSPAFTYMMTAVENAALNGPNAKGITPEHYWASNGGGIYMSNGDGQMVKITATQIQLVDNGTDGVLFACGKTLRVWVLCAPLDPFESCRLFRDMSCSANGKFIFKAWAMSLPHNPKCKPPLAPTGTVGSGKTRVAKGLCELYGMVERIVKADEHGEDDFSACDQ